MIAVDASAILAIVFQEDDSSRFEEALAEAAEGVMSAVNYWECLVAAATRYGEEGARLVETLMERTNIAVAAAGAEEARHAAEAFGRFKGRSGGRLNLGDCFAYALAQRYGDGLLYKGNDFPRTDVRSVV